MEWVWMYGAFIKYSFTLLVTSASVVVPDISIFTEIFSFDSVKSLPLLVNLNSGDDKLLDVKFILLIQLQRNVPTKLSIHFPSLPLFEL